MCLATVYEIKQGNKPIIEDTAHMVIEGNRVEIETLFGEKRVFQGRVRQVDFVKSRVELEEE